MDYPGRGRENLRVVSGGEMNSQDSTTDQLLRSIQRAIKDGDYDAADWILSRMQGEWMPAPGVVAVQR